MSDAMLTMKQGSKEHKTYLVITWGLFVLLALAALIDGKWNQTWCWLGAATAFHALP